MKARKTINVDKSVWYELKKKAFENELTMSDYLSGIFSMVLEGGSQISFSQTGGPPHEGHPDSVPIEFDTARMASAMIDCPVDDEILAKAQEKLEAVRAERKVETAKGPVKANAAMEGFFSPQPKAKWKGAK